MQILAQGGADELIQIAEAAAGIDASIEQSGTPYWKATAAAASNKAKTSVASSRVLQLAVSTGVQRKASQLLEVRPHNAGDVLSVMFRL
jgi:hypothetical protein